MKHDRATLDELDPEVRELIEPHLDPDAETLESISTVLCQKRQDAKVARTSSGIEQLWRECEEAYVGIDDANRHEFSDQRWAKPMSSDGPITTNKTLKNIEFKSTAYIRITARYVDAGVAKLCEILLPADDKSFSITETPVADLIKAKESKSQVFHEGLGVPLTRNAQPGELPPTPSAGPLPPPVPAALPPSPGAGVVPPAAPAGAVLPAGAGPPATGAAPAPPGAPPMPPVAPQVPLTVADLAKENIEIARKKAKMAEDRIYDWLTESCYTAEMRKVLFDAARLGTGCLKGPFPQSSKAIVVTSSANGVNVMIRDRINPAVTWVDIWNIFPDPSCGECIHNGDYMLERDFMSERQIRDLKKLPGYIKKSIDQVLEEGPEQAANQNAEMGQSRINSDSMRKGRFEVWYFYGTLKREEVECIYNASNKNFKEEGVPDSEKQIYVIATLINSCVVRAIINPLDSGSFPYHMMPWQRRSGYCFGIGVGEQVRTPQKMTNAAIRAMLNNAGKSAGSQIVVDQSCIKPADGQWVVTPDKIWYKTGDSPMKDVREAFMAIVIPNVTDQMMKIVDLGLKMAEEATSIPLITQGQSGATTPETFGATQLQDNNANQLLRGIGYSVDDNITEPLIRQCYEWLLLDPDVPDEEKGDFKINAHGSIALVERAIQDQTLAQMAPLSLNPAYKIDPAKWAKVFLKTKRLNPLDLQYTEEEQKKLDAAPPPEAPPVTVAKIAAQVDREKIAAGQTGDQRDLQHEKEIHDAAQVLETGHLQTDQARIAAENARTHAQQVVKLHEIQMKRDVAMLDYANRRNISLDQAKTELAKTAMTLKTQRELNAQEHAVDLHKHHNPPPEKGAPPRVPKRIIPVEPARPLAQTPGRAENGAAFEQVPPP